MARLKLRFPPDPWSARRPATKPKKAPCPRGVRLLALIAPPASNVVALRPEERANEIEQGMAYCVRMCGGCELTEGWTPE